MKFDLIRSLLEDASPEDLDEKPEAKGEGTEVHAHTLDSTKIPGVSDDFSYDLGASYEHHSYAIIVKAGDDIHVVAVVYDPDVAADIKEKITAELKKQNKQFTVLVGDTSCYETPAQEEQEHKAYDKNEEEEEDEEEDEAEDKAGKKGASKDDADEEDEDDEDEDDEAEEDDEEEEESKSKK